MEFLKVGKRLTGKDLVGSGNHGSIYRVSPHYVIKIYHPWVGAGDEFEHEFKIANALYNEGRNVAFPVGLVEVPYLSGEKGSKEVLKKGFMMQYIDGVKGEEV